MTKQQLENKKLILMTRIQQQRLEMIHSTREWIEYTAPIDRSLNTFMKMRKSIFIGVGIAVLFTLKKPAQAAKLTRNAFNLWGATRIVQRLLNY